MVKTAQTYHVPVLLKDSVNGLNIRPGGIYVDVTFGGGGHSREILSRLTADAHLYSFDQDEDAEQNLFLKEGMTKDDNLQDSNIQNFTFVRSNFRYLKNWMRYFGVEHIDGLLADLGVSSHHFDDATRGFSFRYDAPLDMRMNKRAQQKASDVINEYGESSFAKRSANSSGMTSPTLKVTPMHSDFLPTDSKGAAKEDLSLPTPRWQAS